MDMQVGCIQGSKGIWYRVDLMLEKVDEFPSLHAITLYLGRASQTILLVLNFHHIWN